MINIMFLQEFLHVCSTVKFFSSVGLQIFRTSSIVLNYFCNRYSYVISALGLEWHNPCMLAQHINNGENGCIQRIQQLNEHLMLIACDWNKLLDPQ